MAFMAQYNSLTIETWYNGPQSNVQYGKIPLLLINVCLYLYEGIKTTRL